MGNAASKSAKQASRTLPKAAAPKPVPLNRVPPAELLSQTVPQQQRPAGARPTDGHDPDYDFLDKLQKLGTVKYEDIPKPEYKKSNEMIGTIQAREEMWKAAEAARNTPSTSQQPRSRAHPGTVFTILQSIRDGESPERIREDFNLSADFLDRLGPRFSIPTVTAEREVSMSQPSRTQKPSDDEVRQPKKFASKSIEI